MQKVGKVLGGYKPFQVLTPADFEYVAKYFPELFSLLIKLRAH